MNRADNIIGAAFDGLHAEEELKEKTKAFIAQSAGSCRRSTRPAYRGIISAMACLLLVLVGAGGFRVYNTPTTIISVDINPSIELGINRFDKVVSVNAYNEDGDKLADTLKLKALNYEAAVNSLIESSTISDCIARGELLSVAVVGRNEAQTQRILSAVELCAAGCERSICCALDPDRVQAAHENGFSYGKYAAFLELKGLDPNADAQSVQGMTMREIRERIAELSGESEQIYGKQGAGHQYGKTARKD